MDYVISHHPDQSRFITEVDGYTAYAEYVLHNGALDIVHTIVPRPIEGRGIAAALVKETYAYAVTHGLRCAGTCPYAAKWLERHPDLL